MMDNIQDRYSTSYRRGNRPDGCACPPSGALADLAAGRAWPWQRRRLVEHLGSCNDCADDYRVLTRARGGLVGALEELGRANGNRTLPGLRPALAAAALAAFVALGAAVLLESGAPGPVAEPGAIFAGEFESAQARRANVTSPSDEVVFRSDFQGDFADGDGGRVFSDDFGG